MAVIVNITAFNCTTDGEGLTVSNTGWGENTTDPPFSTGSFGAQNAVSPVSIYPGATQPTRGYLRDEAPGSANQIVTATIRRVGALATDQSMYIGARMSAGDDWIAAAYVADAGGDTTGTCYLVKCVNGTRTTLINQSGVGGLGSVGATGVLELRVSGSSPNIEAEVWWNSTQVGTTQTIADAVLDATGKVGIFNRVGGASSATGVHFTTFYAEDDTASGPTLTSPTGKQMTGGFFDLSGGTS